MKFNEAKTFSRFLSLDSAIQIGVFTGLAYFCSLLFEMGYLNYFGAGEESLRVQLETLIFAVFIVITVSVALSYLFFEIQRSVDEEKNVSVRHFKMLIYLVSSTFLLLTPLAFVVNPYDGQNSIWVGSLSSLSIVFLYGLTQSLTWLANWLEKKAKHSVRTRIKRNKEAKYRGDGRNSFSLVVGLVVMIYALAGGSYIASTKREFKLIDFEGQKLIVIREYNQTLIAAAYDSKLNSISNRFIYINLAETTSLDYYMIKTKPNLQDTVRASTPLNR